jgi:nicotinamidase/pyrazinamidase
MDSHHTLDVAHPIFTMDSSGNHPAPFTIIGANDVKKGNFRATNPGWQAKFEAYVNALDANGRYPLCVWPPHCLIGSFGYGIYPPLFNAMVAWEEERFAVADKVTKGSNFFTEHYSAVQADVPDDADPDTQLNQELIDTLERADMILLAGEARSHCLANTVIDIADNFKSEEVIKKMWLLEDATSDVPGFEQMGEDFIKTMKERGMNITNTVDCLA